MLKDWHQSWNTPISPRSNITGRVFEAFTGTTFITQTFCDDNAAENLFPLKGQNIWAYKTKPGKEIVYLF